MITDNYILSDEDKILVEAFLQQHGIVIDRPGIINIDAKKLSQIIVDVYDTGRYDGQAQNDY